MQGNWEVETSNNYDHDMQLLEDKSVDAVEGDCFVTRCALNTYVKEDGVKQHRKTCFLGAMSTIKYVVWILLGIGAIMVLVKF